jgi:hypothetical protein
MKSPWAVQEDSKSNDRCTHKRQTEGRRWETQERRGHVKMKVELVEPHTKECPGSLGLERKQESPGAFRESMALLAPERHTSGL